MSSVPSAILISRVLTTIGGPYPTSPGSQYTDDIKTPNHVAKTAVGAERAVCVPEEPQSQFGAPGTERSPCQPEKMDRRVTRAPMIKELFHACL